MEWFVRWFIRSALAWLGVGGLLGLSMTFWPESYLYRPAHVHANLLGFVSMMIFGVAYHVMPRFTGRPLFRRSWAGAHFWLANLGLAFLVGGWILRPHAAQPGTWTVRAGGVVSGVGLLLFIVNLWVTVGKRPVKLSPRTPTFDRSSPSAGSTS